MHKFVLQIIYSNYLRSICPNIHISILNRKKNLFLENVHYEPQLQANSPKPHFGLEESDKFWWKTRVRDASVL